VSADSAIDEEPVAVQPLSVDMRRLTRVGSRPNFLDYLFSSGTSGNSFFMMPAPAFKAALGATASAARGCC